MTRATRRELLAGAGTAVAAGGVLALGAPVVARGASATASDADRLRRLISVELLLLYCYRHVLASSVLTEDARGAVSPFPAQEAAHISALTRRLTARGGHAPAPPASVHEANRDLAHRRIGGRLGQLRGNPDALRLLLAVEQVVVGAYFVALTKLSDPELVALACSIMANDAQHDAVIRLAMPKATPGNAVPYGLVQGLQ